MKSKKRTVTQAMKNAWAEALLSKFLLVTFTDAAAKEMRSRVAGTFLAEGYEIDPEKIPCMTFNAIDMDLLKKFYKDLDFEISPSVIDVNPTREASKVLPLIVGENKIPGLNYSVPIEMNGGQRGAIGALALTLKVFSIIRLERIDTSSDFAFDDLKKTLEKAGLYKKMSDKSIKKFLELFDTYADILKTEGLITFADQEPMGIEILDLHPEYLKSLGIEHVVVDEFQDSNDVNMEFVKRLCDCMESEGGTIKSIMVIGDDAQSIYSFRNANVSNMTHFDEKMADKNVTHLYMTKNYRSYSEIVDVANELIMLNVNRIDKPLTAAKGKGGKFEVKGFYDNASESEYVVDLIKRLLAEGRKPSDICIIQRTKKPLNKIASDLTKAEIPWVMMAPIKVIENSRVHAALSLTEAFFDPDATCNYKEYLNALCDGKLNETYDAIELANAINDLKFQISNFENLEPSFALNKYHKMLEAIAHDDEIYLRFLDMLYDEEKARIERAKLDGENLLGLSAALSFMKEFKRFGVNTEMKMEQSYEGVALTTAHSSKGLEWPIVINMISAYDNYQLHDARNVEAIEEERRLLFVSMTRAMDELYVTGQYVAYANEKSGEVYNQFLKSLYYIVDPTGINYVPVDPEKAVREAQRREERNRKAREARAAKRDALLDQLDNDGFLPSSKTGKKIKCDTDYSDKKTKGRKRSGEMSEERKKWYDELTKDCKQLTLSDCLN